MANGRCWIDGNPRGIFQAPISIGYADAVAEQRNGCSVDGYLARFPAHVAVIITEKNRDTKRIIL